MSLRYLNLSKLDLSAQSVSMLSSMILNNPTLEKLLLQHNCFVLSCIKLLGQSIESHPSLQYLDLSANNLGDEGFFLLL